MLSSYLALAINTFGSYLIIPLDQPYVEQAMLASMVGYNKIAIALVTMCFTMLALLANMVVGFVIHHYLRRFIPKKGLDNMDVSCKFFYKYCLLFCPVLSFISPYLIVVFSAFCGFLGLFRWRILLAMSFEFLSNIILYIK